MYIGLHTRPQIGSWSYQFRKHFNRSAGGIHHRTHFDHSSGAIDARAAVRNRDLKWLTNLDAIHKT